MNDMLYRFMQRRHLGTSCPSSRLAIHGAADKAYLERQQTHKS